MTSVGPQFRARLERLSTDWRAAAALGKPVEVTPGEVRELADALAAALVELDDLHAQVAALKEAGDVVVVARVEPVAGRA